MKDNLHKRRRPSLVVTMSLTHSLTDHFTFDNIYDYISLQINPIKPGGDICHPKRKIKLNASLR